MEKDIYNLLMKHLMNTDLIFSESSYLSSLHLKYFGSFLSLWKILFYKMKWLFLSIVGRWRLGHWRKVCLFLIFTSTVTRQTFSICCQHLRVGARNPPLHILHVTLSGHLTSTCSSLLQLVTWAIPFRIWERLSSLKSFPPQLPKWSLPRGVGLL